MGQKKIFKVISIVILAFTLIFIIAGISSKGKIATSPVFEADGKGMVSIRFNKENKKVLEIKCSESERETDDKILMKDIRATVFKKGKIEKDIKISGKNGIVENNFHNFTISNQAQITSEDLLARCKSFAIMNQEIVSTEERVNYQVKSLKGIAEKGMRLNIKKNLLFLYSTKGTYEKEGKSFDYKANFLKFDDVERSLRMRENSKISNEETILKGDRILLQFTVGYEDVALIESWGNCYFYLKEKSEGPGKEFKEAKAAHIKNTYNEGNLKKSRFERNVTIKLKTKLNTTNVSSDEIIILHNEKTGKIKSIELAKPSNIKNTGKKKFRCRANKMDIEYNKDGEISSCKSRGKSIFTIDKYQGTSFLMTYDIDKNSVSMKGKGSKVVYKKNSFESTKFDVDTEEKKLVSSAGVLSIILLDAKKSNVLFSNDLIYINSNKIEISDKEGTFIYEDDVELRQKDTILTAGKLSIDGDNNLVASGKEVSLSFKDKEDEVRIKGKEIIFDAKNKKIEIKKGIIESMGNLLRADVLRMEFSNVNDINEIYGEEKVDFIKEEDNISGSSKKVKWLYTKQEIIFINSAQIQREGRGTTKGNELRFFLKDNRILITSDESKRTETIIENKKKD
jgi:lipopolysaccharide export system protein LptA